MQSARNLSDLSLSLLPLGVSGISYHQLVDVDETGFYLKSCASNYGRGCIAHCVRYPSNYTQHEPKLNAITAIEAGNLIVDSDLNGSLANPRTQIQVMQGNCNQFIFADFLNTFF